MEKLYLEKNSWEEDLGVLGESTFARRLRMTLATLMRYGVQNKGGLVRPWHSGDGLL